MTGATGFVGRHIVAHLRDAGFRVRALVRESSDLSPIRSSIDEFVVGDLGDPHSLEGCCDGVDAVIHSACAVAGTFDSGRAAESEFMRVNRDGTVNLATEVLRHEGLRIVHVSSTAAMGTPQSPIVDENSPCNPRAPYQRSKRAAELELLRLHEDHGLNVVIVRPCVVAGRGKDFSELRTLYKLVRRGVFPFIGTNLHVQKPLIHVDDLVQALVLATDKGQAGGVYLVHSGARHTFGEILEVAGEIAGVRRTHFHVPLALARAAAVAFGAIGRFAPDWNPPITDDRIQLFLTDRRIDISRAVEDLGYAPQRQTTRAVLEDPFRYYATIS